MKPSNELVFLSKKITSSEFIELLDTENNTIDFEKGKYFLDKSDAIRMHYEFSNTTDSNEQYIGLLIKNRKKLVIDGHNSTFVFRGHLSPFVIDSCEDIVLKNFVIDFEPPLVAEAQVVDIGDDFIDVKIDKSAFPYVVENDWLYFDIGEENLSPLHKHSQIHFDTNMTVSDFSGDSFCVKCVKSIGEGKVRLFPDNPESIKCIKIGNYFVLRHNQRLHPGIFIENSQRITLENIIVHSCGGLGILAQFSEDLTIRNVNFLPNKAKGRQISSGRDDGIHITSCRGTVLVEQCSFLGLMDDPINIHGCSMKLEEVIDNGKTIRARYMHDQAKNFLYYARKGDVIHILNQKSMNVIKKAIVESFERESDDTILLHLNDELIVFDGEYAIENVSSTAEFICRNNRFGSCRARGLLISTPKKVIVEENLFESSGSAILIAGDANYWYESGECHDVTISKNVFTNRCMSSLYEFTYGIISICPVVPFPDKKYPFHKNIHIERNIFDIPDTPVLYAFSTQNLIFADNRIFVSNSRKSICEKNALINLSYCNDVTIEKNILTGLYPDEFIECEHSENIISDRLIIKNSKRTINYDKNRVNRLFFR